MSEDSSHRIYSISILICVNKWRYPLAGIFLAFMLLLPACSPQVTEPALRIGTNNWAGYEPLYLARSLGYYQDTPIKLVELPSTTEVIHALRSGTLEGAALTLDETLTLLEDGISLKVILVTNFSNGGDVLLAKPEIGSLAALRGKRIAVEYRAVGAIILDAALDVAGLKASDITIVSCTQDKHLGCYLLADAVVTFEPIRTKLLNLGARQLFDSSQILGRIVDVLVVLAEATNTHKRSLKDLLAGYFKARKYFDTQPDDALKQMSIRQGLTPVEVLAAYDGLILPELDENRSLLSGNPSPLQRTASRLSEFMLGKKLLQSRLRVDDLTDSRFLPDGTP